MLKFAKKNFICLLFLIALASCISRTNKHGYMFDLSDHDQLKEEITTKDVVLRIMGSPTLVADFSDEETWIYFAEDVKSLLFFKPTIVSRTIISIKFNNNTIKELQRFDLSNQSDLKFAINYTEVKSNKIGFFKSILSNIGQVKPQ